MNFNKIITITPIKQLSNKINFKNKVLQMIEIKIYNKTNLILVMINLKVTNFKISKNKAQIYIRMKVKDMINMKIEQQLNKKIVNQQKIHISL